MVYDGYLPVAWNELPDYFDGEAFDMALHHADPFLGYEGYEDPAQLQEDYLIDQFDWTGPGEGPASGDPLYYYEPLPIEVETAGVVSLFFFFLDRVSC